VGVVYFLGNANIIQVSWNLIWPLLLIAGGAAILVSAMRPRADLPGSVTVPREGVDQLELELTLGAGTFKLRGGSTGLVDVHSNRQDVVSRVNHRANRSRVRLSQDARWLPFGTNGSADWDVGVAPDVATALTVSG